MDTRGKIRDKRERTFNSPVLSFDINSRPRLRKLYKHMLKQVRGVCRRGESIDKDFSILKLLKISCPLCRGDGFYDWVKVARQSDVVKTFKIATGNMDIYISKCVDKWMANATYQTRDIKIYRMFQQPERLIEFSQRHYVGIQLNNRLLSMSAEELHDLSVKCFQYKFDLMALKESELTGNKIKEILESIGLSDFVPDEFAYPGPYDYPS